MKWVSIEKELPPLSKAVLCFYQIEETPYYTQCRLDSIITIKKARGTEEKTEWFEANSYDSINPTHWCDIEPPDAEEVKGGK
jgi:hypothetical protein